ncbi:MAG: MFS transporter [Pseudomonadota bacterium]
MVKYALVLGLYLAQGLPGGLMAYTLPMLLREQGASLSMISLLSVLSLPWACKLLWSRPLDASDHKQHWFFMTFFVSFCVWAILSQHDLNDWFTQYQWAFCALLLFANFAMASQDVLTDGLVVRLLNAEDRGIANSLQVVAYKVGMLISGALLINFYDQLGWQRSIALLLCVLCLAYLPLLWVAGRTQYLVYFKASNIYDSSGSAAIFDTSRNALWGVVKDFIRLPGMVYWLSILALYKLGDGMISSITKPFWVDIGIAKPVIAQTLSVGTAVSIGAGFVAGFMWKTLVKKGVEIRQIVAVFALLQCASIAGYLALSVFELRLVTWQILVVFEQVVDVMSTVVIFASMMSVCRQATAGVDYTFQLTLLLICSQSLHVASGVLADYFGYTAVFAIALVLTFPVILLLLNKRAFNRLSLS